MNGDSTFELYNEAVNQINLLHYDKALEILGKIVGKEPYHHKLWINKYLVLTKLNKNEEASKAYNEILEIADCFVDNNERQQGLEVLNEFLEILTKITTEDPKNYRAWIDKGPVLTKLDKQEDASNAYDEALGIAIDLINNQRYEEALEALKRLTTDVSTNFSEWREKEQFLIKLKNSEIVEQIILKYSDNYGLWIEKGLILDKLNKKEEASKAYDEALEIAENLVKNQRYEEALEILEKLTDANFKNYRVLIGKFRVLTKLNKNEEASKAYNEVLEIADGLIENDKLQLGLDVLNELLELLTKITTEGPKNYRTWIDKGRILAKLSKQEEASKAYYKALEIAENLVKNEGYEEALEVLNEIRSIAIDLIDKQKHQEAVDVLNKLIAVDSKNYKALNDKGRALAGLNKYEDAIIAYNEALDINPSYIPAYNEKGIALRELKKNREARIIFDSVLKKNPKDAYALNNLGITYYYSEEYAKAIEQLDKAKELKPEDHTSFYYKGLVLYSLKDYSEACKSLGEAINKYEDKERRIYAEALYHQGLAYIKLNNDEEAKKRLEDALKIFNKAINEKDSLYNSYNYKGLVLRELARLEEDKKNRKEKYESALDCFEKAIEEEKGKNEEKVKETSGCSEKYIHQPKKCAAAYRNKALVLHDLKKYRDAIKSLDKAIENDPSSMFSRNNKGVCLYSLRNYTDSLKEFEEVLKINPNDTYALNYKGLALYSLDKYSEAEETFKKITEGLNKKHPDAWNNLGLVYYETERYKKALVAFNRAKNLDPNNCSYYNNIIFAFAGLGSKKGFLTAFERAKEKFPKSAESWNNKAICHAQFNEYEEAISSFDHAIEIDPNYTLAIKNKALIMRMFGKEKEKEVWDEAIKKYEAHLEDCKEDVFIMNEKAFAYRKLEKYEDAKKELKKALEINGKYAEALNNLGICNLGSTEGTSVKQFLQIHKESPEYCEALKHFQKALDINSEYAEAWVNKGITLLKLESYKEGYVALIKAFCLYKKYTKINADSRRAWYNIGLLRYDLHHYNAAIRALRKATSKGENLQLNPHAWNTLGLSYYHLRKYNDAIEAFNRAAKFNQEDIDILHNLGLTCCKSGYYHEALNFFEKALTIHPSNIHLLYNKGRALVELKKYEDARKVFNDVIMEADINISILDGGNSDLYHIKARAIFYVIKCNKYLSRDSDKTVEETIKDKCSNQANNSSNHNVRGITYYLCKQYPKALENLKKSTYIEKECPDFLYKEGMILYKMGEYEKALNSFEKSTNLNPHCVNAWNYKGLTHIKLNKVEEAKESFETATKINPKEAWGYINLSNILLNYEDILGAKNQLKKVRNKDLEDETIKSRVCSLKGQIELENEEPNYQKAMGYFCKAVSANPEEISNHLWYAYVRYLNADLLYNKENVEKVETDNNSSPSNQRRQRIDTKYQQALLSIIRDLENVPFLSTKQEKYKKKLNNSLEKKCTEKNLRITKENQAYLLYFLGYLYYNLKDYFSAKEKFKKCLRLNSRISAEKSARQLSFVCYQHMHTLWWNWWLNPYTSIMCCLIKGFTFLTLVLVLLMLLIPPDLANNIYYIIPSEITSRIPDEISPVDWTDKVTQNTLLTVIIIFVLLSPDIKRIKSEQIEIELYTPPHIAPNLYPSTPPSEFAKITEKLADPGGLKKSLLLPQPAELSLDLSKDGF